ncbi:MAG TPA: hypothetical protein PK080_00415 [Hyphomonadaceae bacterium]|nr:hypothetical protein [Hyphomonadaceae bacterium]
MNTSKSNNTGAVGIREAVIGFSDDGCVVYYFPEDVHIDDDGNPDLDSYSYIGQPSRPGEPEPILALKEAGTGLWVGDPCQWVAEHEKEVVATGRIAFTEEDARFLEDAAVPGDLIIRFKEGVRRG